MKHRQCGGLHEAVEPDAGEAHMVSAADMVDARLIGLRQERASNLRTLLEQAEGREHADPGRCSRAASCVRPLGRRSGHWSAAHVIFSRSSP